MLVLLRSIIDGTRRTWYALLVGCFLGGLGAGIAGHVFADSQYVYYICGVSAVMAENVVLGLFNASREFRDAPIKVFSQMWRLIVPSFGRTVPAVDPTTAGDNTPPPPAAG